MGYKYFDTPDGSDCEKKLGYLVKKATVIGVFLSSTHVLAIETPPTYGLIFARFARITVPFVTAAAVGAMSVCMLVGYRQKDDIYNHMYGGMLAGIAGGAVKGNIGHGIFAGLLIGGLASVYKHSKVHGYELEKLDFKLNTDDHWTKDYDLRITKPTTPEWVAK